MRIRDLIRDLERRLPPGDLDWIRGGGKYRHSESSGEIPVRARNGVPERRPIEAVGSTTRVVP